MALGWAAQFNHIPVFRWLVENIGFRDCATMTASMQRKTCIEIATTSGFHEIVSFLEPTLDPSTDSTR